MELPKLTCPRIAGRRMALLLRRAAASALDRPRARVNGWAAQGRGLALLVHPLARGRALALLVRRLARGKVLALRVRRLARGKALAQRVPRPAQGRGLPLLVHPLAERRALALLVRRVVWDQARTTLVVRRAGESLALAAPQAPGCALLRSRLARRLSGVRCR